MAQILELPNKIHKAAILKMFQQLRILLLRIRRHKAFMKKQDKNKNHMKVLELNNIMTNTLIG